MFFNFFLFLGFGPFGSHSVNASSVAVKVDKVLFWVSLQTKKQVFGLFTAGPVPIFLFETVRGK